MASGQTIDTEIHASIVCVSCRLVLEFRVFIDFVQYVSVCVYTVSYFALSVSQD